MNHKERHGFVIILVLTTLALMAAMFVVLGNCSQILLFESNIAYLDAANRNLSASAFAWAKYNIGHNNQNIPTGRLPLDVSAMKMSNATLSLDITPPTSSKSEVIVHTSVYLGRQRLHKDIAFDLP